ncbi:MAG: PAS domain S-box protein, partial [Anaerolineae bacterium]|nr:PAS domain S-box protein [Anaerolineae bacterium]
MLELDGGLSSDQRDNVLEILRAGRHLLHLINEVLDLARIEAGKLELSLEPVAISPLIGECVQLTSTLAEKQQIALSREEMPGVFVRGDALRLKQVVLNLLSNAIKYNREAGTVTVAGQAADGGRYRIVVSDTGPGIPAGKIDALFQPFQRLVGANSKVEGTGIGLTICKRLIEEMHGQMGVESVVGEGSRFWFEVPLAEAHGVEATEAPQRRLQIAEGGDVELAEQLYVLCVDDNPSNLKFLSRLLERRGGIRVDLAATPNAGIERA